MSISSIYAQITPRERALYPDGINVILALLGLGGSGEFKAAALQMFGSDQAMIDYVQRIHALDASPEIRSESGLFFTQEQRVIRENYYNLVRDLASVFRVNFQDPATVVQLNQWIQERSGFPNVLNPAMVVDAYLVAINTLWFKDTWVHPFSEYNTKPAPFYRHDGSSPQVATMHLFGVKGLKYYQDAKFTAVQLPFTHGAIAEFVMGLPASSDVSGDIPYVSSPMQSVEVFLPKFKHQEKIDLKPVSKAAGLGSVFETAGQLLGLTDNPNAHISLFEQIIYAEFNEKGAEVRVSTMAVAIVVPAMRIDPPITLRFDRPFHYRITKSGSTLLQGYFEARSS